MFNDLNNVQGIEIVELFVEMEWLVLRLEKRAHPEGFPEAVSFWPKSSLLCCIVVVGNFLIWNYHLLHTSLS